MSPRPLSLRHLEEINGRYSLGLPKTGPSSIENAFKKARETPWRMDLTGRQLKGFQTFEPSRREDNLLTRASAQVLQRLLAAKQSNRHSLISALIELLRDPTPLSLTRLDIRRFYESIPRSTVKASIDENLLIPKAVRTVLTSIFTGCDHLNLNGLPRGLATSTVLAEKFLEPIDLNLRSLPSTIFYCRYVDDILVLSSAAEKRPKASQHLKKQLALNGNLEVNPKKTADHDLPTYRPAAARCQFDYLGYSFDLQTQKKGERLVSVDIAKAKANRLRTKLCRAAAAFLRDKNFSLLKDRVRCLTSNFYLPGDHPHGRPRAGIFYSYPNLSESSYSSGRLAALDRFTSSLFLSSSTNLSRRLAQELEVSKRRQLARLSFSAGHKNRLMASLSESRVGLALACWKYE